MGFASTDAVVRGADSIEKLDQGYMSLATSKPTAEERVDQKMEAAIVYALWKSWNIVEKLK